MRRALVAGFVVLVVVLGLPMSARLAPPAPVIATMDADRFDVSAEGNAVTGLRRAPVPYSSMIAVSAAWPVLFQTLPYVLTLIAVAGVIGRSIPPAAIGRPYVKQ